MSGALDIRRPPEREPPGRLAAVPDAGRRLLAVASGCLALLTVVAFVAGREFPAPLFVVVGVVAAVALRWPLVGALAAIVASGTYGWVVVGPRVSVFQVLVVGAAAGALLAARADIPAFAARARRRPELLLLAAFTGWLVVAGIVRRDAQVDWAFVRTYVGALIFFSLLAFLLRDDRRRGWALGAVVVGAVATALLGFAQLVSSDAFVGGYVLEGLQPFRDVYTRFAVPFGMAALVSNFSKDVLVGFAIVLALGPVLWAAGGWRRWSWVALTVLLGLALVMSGSRSGWLAAVAAAGYVALVERRSRLVLVTAGIAVAVLVVCMARPITPTDLQVAAGLPRDAGRDVPLSRGDAGSSSDASADSAQARLAPGQRTESSTELSNQLRVRLNVAGLEMVRDHPVFGIGPGAFRNYLPQYENTTAYDSRPHLPSHNVFMEIWADSGTPALVLYLGFLGVIGLSLERVRRRSTGERRAMAVAVSAGILALLVTSAFHNYAEDNHLWTLCGIAASWALWSICAGRAGPRA